MMDVYPHESLQKKENQGLDQLEELDVHSRVAILIDDLSSEEPSLKRRSFQRLLEIANVLGIKRVEEELIPLCEDLIDRIDDQPQLMICLATQLAKLSDFLGPEKSRAVLRSLEIICASEDHIVSQQSVASITKIAVKMPQEQHLNDIQPLITRLAKGDSYSQRTAACGLFHVCYPKLESKENKDQLRDLFLELCKDDTPMVRRGAASYFAAFMEVIPEAEMKEIFLPQFGVMLKDEQHSVKIKIIESTPALGKLMKKSDFFANLIPYLKQGANDSKSWRLRFVVADATGSAAYLMGPEDKEVISKEMVPIIEQLLADSEAQVRSQAISQLPKVLRHADIELVGSKLFTLISDKIAKDQSQHVRGALAHSICAIGSIIGQYLCSKHVVPIIETILKNQEEELEVKLSLLSHVGEIDEVIGTEKLALDIVPTLIELANDKKWRVRLGMIPYLSKICKMLLEGGESGTFFEKLEPLCTKLIMDPMLANREAAVQNLIDLKPLLGDKWFLEKYMSCIREQIKGDQKFMMRMFGLRMIELGLTHLLDQLDELVQILCFMCKDKVPNIQLKAAQIFQKLRPEMRPSQWEAKARPALISIKESTQDFDAKFFAEQALKE